MQNDFYFCCARFYFTSNNQNRILPFFTELTFCEISTEMCQPKTENIGFCLIIIYCRGYLIVAPRVVRPAMTFRLRVSIHKRFNHGMQVVAHLSQDSHQYARAMVQFQDATTRQLELDVSILFFSP